MAHSEPIIVTLLLSGRPYSLQIDPADEAIIRMLVSELNTKIDQFQIAHPKRDRQDCLAMVLLTMAVELQKDRTQRGEEDRRVEQRLDAIGSFLEGLSD